MIDSDAATDRCTVAVVGGGTSGLALAAELKRLKVGRVVVLERETRAGGVARHCGHYPFGLREYGRLLKGPQYAEKNRQTAIELGVEIYAGTTVTEIHARARLSLSSASGCRDLYAERVVLCTGVRESSRAQRSIGGDRPLGIISTGALQSLVFLQGKRPFKKPVILGSELVSFSAIGTCNYLGIRPLAMIEERDRIVTHRALQPYLCYKGVPLYCGIQSLKIIGRDRVEAIEFSDAIGQRKRISTDGVIVSGRFRPEATLLHGHLAIDPGSGGPVVNQFAQCSDPDYFCAGNLLRPAESSAWCWREGVQIARHVAQDLVRRIPLKNTLKLKVDDPAIQFILPQRLSLSDHSGGMRQLQIGLKQAVHGTLQASVDKRCVWKTTLRSRPVRRALKPLPEVFKNHPGAEIHFSVVQES